MKLTINDVNKTITIDGTPSLENLHNTLDTVIDTWNKEYRVVFKSEAQPIGADNREAQLFVLRPEMRNTPVNNIYIIHACGLAVCVAVDLKNDSTTLTCNIDNNTVLLTIPGSSYTRDELCAAIESGTIHFKHTSTK